MRKLKLHELGRKTIAEYKRELKRPVILVLDNIRSAHNVGSIFRTADAFAVQRIYLTGITAQPPHREIQKTAIGATDSVEWKYLEDPIDAVKEILNEGYSVYPVEQTDQAVAINTVEFPEKVALVFGNEVHGVSKEVIAMFDRSLEIPQFGTKHSFNVSVSVGIVLWEVCR